MALPGELDLDERREHGELLARLAHHLLVHGQHGVRRSRRQALGVEEALQRLFGGLRDGELLHRATHVTTEVAGLQPACEHGVERRSRDDSQLAEARHGTREPPVGDPHPHAALDDDGLPRRGRSTRTWE
jgi:hypothetical protein